MKSRRLTAPSLKLAVDYHSGGTGRPGCAHSKSERLMSALGQKQTSRLPERMSALPPKADIGTQSWNVRFVPKGDISNGFTPVCSEGLLNRSGNRNSASRMLEIPAGNKVANQGLKVATLLGYASRKLGPPAGGRGFADTLSQPKERHR